MAESLNACLQADVIACRAGKIYNQKFDDVEGLREQSLTINDFAIGQRELVGCGVGV